MKEILNNIGKRNQILGSIALLLFVISLFVYNSNYKIDTHLADGSDFLKGLDVEKIDKIIVEQQGKVKIELKKDRLGFVLSSHKSYPANNELVNKFLFNLSNIQIVEMVTKNTDKYKVFKVEDKLSQNAIKLFDSKGNKIVEFYIGEELKGRGNYLRSAGNNIVYLSSEVVKIETNRFKFIKKEILNISNKDIKKITVKKRKGYVISKDDKKFIVWGGNPKKHSSDKIDSFVRDCSKLDFIDYYSLEDSEVRNINFKKNVLKIQASDFLVYGIGIKEHSGKYFLKVSATLENAPSEVRVKKEDSKKELKKKEIVLLDRDKAKSFNRKNQIWVYEISKEKYESLNKKVSDFNK